MSKPTIKFTLTDPFYSSEFEFKTTLAGNNIDLYYDAFEAFLLTAGFLQESIDERYAK